MPAPDIQDNELIDLLKDGDERIKPSNKIATVKSNFTQNLPTQDVKSGSTEEQLEVEVEQNLRTVIEYGNNAIRDLADLASSSEHPRPYEALSNLMKSVADANMALLSIKKKDKSRGPENRFGKVDGEPSSGGSEGQPFVAISVADLLSEIEKRKPEPEYKVING